MKSLTALALMTVLVIGSPLHATSVHTSASTRVQGSSNVQGVDELIIEFAARHCRFPTLEDTLYVVSPPGWSVTLGGTYDQWAHAFVYNYPAVPGALSFDLYSRGKNGIDESGRGDDIANWEVREDRGELLSQMNELEFWNEYSTELFGRPGHFEYETDTLGGPLLWPLRTWIDVVPKRQWTEFDGVITILSEVAVLDILVVLVFLLLKRNRIRRLALLTVVWVVALGGSKHSDMSKYHYTRDQLHVLQLGVLSFRADSCRLPGPTDSLTYYGPAGVDSLASLGAAKDYWGRPFVLRSPSGSTEDLFHLYSTGRNGVDEGGLGDDIGLWDQEEVSALHYDTDGAGRAWLFRALPSPLGVHAALDRIASALTERPAWIRWIFLATVQVLVLDVPLLILILTWRAWRARLPRLAA